MTPTGLEEALMQLQQRVEAVAAQLRKAQHEIESATWDFEAPLFVDLGGEIGTATRGIEVAG